MGDIVVSSVIIMMIGLLAFSIPYWVIRYMQNFGVWTANPKKRRPTTEFWRKRS